VTLLLVFRATDGLLLLADGRRTRTPAWSLDSVPMDDTAKKSAVTPAGNAVAMAAGSTRIGDRYAAEIFEDAIAEQPDAAAPTVESVARACYVRGLGEAWPSSRRKLGSSAGRAGKKRHQVSRDGWVECQAKTFPVPGIEPGQRVFLRRAASSAGLWRFAGTATDRLRRHWVRIAGDEGLASRVQR
jgi:hypothetical protein